MTESMVPAWAPEVQRRRTFAIISHPDAGKTTLTEKLLLFGGAIRMAGTVKGRKASKFATSDWMEIEKQRGISVTSSVMQFDYEGYRINILDTPGHQDFSEDTYRTLMAADAAVMLIDTAKGVEAQTIKLFQVCRKRGIPIFTFVNKMDREGKPPLELLEELERVLEIRSCPMNWPIGMGKQFFGVYDRQRSVVERFESDKSAALREEMQALEAEAISKPDAEADPTEQVLAKVKNQVAVIPVKGWDDPQLTEWLPAYQIEQLQEEMELIDIAGDAFDAEKVAAGELTPVFFGSAVNNFGVQSFLEHFLRLAPAPGAKPNKSSDDVSIEPMNEAFSGFVFKIQANMNPAHRDRIAFLRVVSGKFERGMVVKHARAGKEIKLNQPTQFLAQDRQIVEEAFAGDIIGLFDPGMFRIGDTLHTGNKAIAFEELPTFSPELFCKVSVKNALKHKQYQKGIDQLTEEGTIQVFRTMDRLEEPIIGVVGQLQFEVFEYRMRNEYGVELLLQRMPFSMARWIVGAEPEPTKFRIHSALVRDKRGYPVALFESEYAMYTAREKYPDAEFLSVSPV